MKKLLISTLTLTFALTLSVLSFAVEVPAKSAIPAIPTVEMKTVSAPSVEMIDINSATEAQLKRIPGISDEYAKKIIGGRPFANKSQLLSKKIIPKPVYDKVKDMIIAKKIKK